MLQLTQALDCSASCFRHSTKAGAHASPAMSCSCLMHVRHQLRGEGSSSSEEECEKAGQEA